MLPLPATTTPTTPRYRQRILGYSQREEALNSLRAEDTSFSQGKQIVKSSRRSLLQAPTRSSTFGQLFDGRGDKFRQNVVEVIARLKPVERYSRCADEVVFAEMVLG